jgi:hypothetical protein
MNPRNRERLTVERDGERIEVFNWVNVERPAVINAGGRSIERFEANIGAGDSPATPDAVTAWIAEELWHEFGVEPEDYGIEFVDIESDEVTVL